MRDLSSLTRDGTWNLYPLHWQVDKKTKFRLGLSTEERPCEDRAEEDHCKPRKEDSAETNSADTLNLGLQAAGL